jgi:hypothetical protein
MHGRDIRASVAVKALLIRGGFSFKTGRRGPAAVKFLFLLMMYNIDNI